MNEEGMIKRLVARYREWRYSRTWELGTCGNHKKTARKHRKEGNVQFVLWRAGEHGHSNDYWHKLLIGVAIGDLLKVGHVYEITETIGGIQIIDIGESAIIGAAADNGSIDRLLALGGGIHCIVKD